MCYHEVIIKVCVRCHSVLKHVSPLDLYCEEVLSTPRDERKHGDCKMGFLKNNNWIYSGTCKSIRGHECDRPVSLIAPSDCIHLDYYIKLGKYLSSEEYAALQEKAEGKGKGKERVE